MDVIQCAAATLFPLRRFVTGTERRRVLKHESNDPARASERGQLRAPRRLLLRALLSSVACGTVSLLFLGTTAGELRAIGTGLLTGAVFGVALTCEIADKRWGAVVPALAAWTIAGLGMYGTLVNDGYVEALRDRGVAGALQFLEAAAKDAGRYVPNSFAFTSVFFFVVWVRRRGLCDMVTAGLGSSFVAAFAVWVAFSERPLGPLVLSCWIMGVPYIWSLCWLASWTEQRVFQGSSHQCVEASIVQPARSPDEGGDT